jgi:hypothetical protein
MAKFLLLIALSAVFAAAILAGSVAAARHTPKAPTAPALTTDSSSTSVVPIVGGGRMNY